MFNENKYSFLTREKHISFGSIFSAITAPITAPIQAAVSVANQGLSALPSAAIAGTPIASGSAAISLANEATGGALANAPIIGPDVRNAINYTRDQSPSNTLAVLGSAGKYGAAGYGGATAGLLGAGAGYTIAGNLQRGNLEGALTGLGGSLGIDLGEYGEGFNQLKGLVSGLGSRGPASIAPVNNITPASQNYVSEVESSSSGLLLMLAIGVGGYFVLKKMKVI